MLTLMISHKGKHGPRRASLTTSKTATKAYLISPNKFWASILASETPSWPRPPPHTSTQSLHSRGTLGLNHTLRTRKAHLPSRQHLLICSKPPYRMCQATHSESDVRISFQGSRAIKLLTRHVGVPGLNARMLTLRAASA